VVGGKFLLTPKSQGLNVGWLNLDRCEYWNLITTIECQLVITQAQPTDDDAFYLFLQKQKIDVKCKNLVSVSTINLVNTTVVTERFPFLPDHFTAQKHSVGATARTMI
jgi:hypothetical protein